MAGIKQMEKRPEHLNFIQGELLKPDVRPAMFDDSVGFVEAGLMLYDPLSVVYGIFEKGHPVPIGCVILRGLMPFRGCEVHAAIFKAENRNAKKMQAVAQMVKHDLIHKWNVHYAETRVVAGNEVAKHLVEKLGFTKVGTKPENVLVGGKYVDVDEYYAVLNGEKFVRIPEF